jgi:hypothetical protein
MIDAPHQDAQQRLIGAEQFDLLVLDAKVLLFQDPGSGCRHLAASISISEADQKDGGARSSFGAFFSFCGFWNFHKIRFLVKFWIFKVFRLFFLNFTIFNFFTAFDEFIWKIFEKLSKNV